MRARTTGSSGCRPTSGTPTPEFLADNPLGKVPALTTDDGLPLFDSRVICEYLDSLHDGHEAVSARQARRGGGRCG